MTNKSNINQMNNIHDHKKINKLSKISVHEIQKNPLYSIMLLNVQPTKYSSFLTFSTFNII